MNIRLMAPLLALVWLSPPAWAAEAKKPAGQTIEVPYRLTNFNHVMVRAKLNGKGPYNFIVDTGAPALFVATAAASKVGVTPGKNGWGTFDRFEIEGGVVIEKCKARIEDPFQLKGMNGMGLAGMELHGMIGYTILARYRIEFDFTRSKMKWTPNDFDPGTPQGLNGRGGAGGLDAMGAIMQMLGSLLGKKPTPDVRPRPFLGVDVAEDDRGVVVKSVLARGPAATAGLKVGDRITEFRGRTVREKEDLARYLGHAEVGDSADLTVVRDSKNQELTVKLGEGL